MSGLPIIQSDEQLTRMLQLSAEKPLLLYKHSSQCGSSKVAHVGINHFVNRYPEIASRFAIGVIRVVEEKHLSDRVAGELGIPHVSPQILLVRQGRVVWHAGHQQINSQQLCRAAMLYGQPLPG